VYVRNADLVGMADDSQMPGNAAVVSVAYQYPPPPVAAEPLSGRVPGDAARGRGGDGLMTEGDTVPMPVRVTKPRRPKDTSADDDVTVSSTEDLTAPGAYFSSMSRPQADIKQCCSPSVRLSVTCPCS